MPGGTSEPNPQRAFLGVAVGNYKHSDKYPALDKALPDVREIAEVLKRDQFKVCVLTDLSERGLQDEIKEFLQPNFLQDGGSLVLLWSGHGEPQDDDLSLPGADMEPDATGWITAKRLAEAATRTGASQILLIFDTCYAGKGVIFAVKSADQILMKQRPGDRVWMGVVSSALDFERARDGVFGQRLIKLLLHGPDDPDLRQRWSAKEKYVRFSDLVEGLDDEWKATQTVKSLQLGGVRQRILTNPIYIPPNPELMDAHLLQAARGTAPGEDGFYFSGRQAELDRAVAWMQGAKAGTLAIIGPAGIGKSALLGRLVSLSNRTERAQVLAQGPPEHADPGQDSVQAHVHALRYTAERFVEEIDEQLIRSGFLEEDPAGPRNRESLQGAILASGRLPVIAIDGLDEASEGWRIAREVLRTLGEVSLLLVATADLPPKDTPLSLVKTLGACEVIDLGADSVRQAAEPDLRRYIENRLTGCSPAMDPAKVAEHIVAFSREQQSGAFLLARVLTTQLRRTPVDTSTAAWQQQVTLNVEGGFDQFVAALPKPQLAHDLLEALAWAEGPGVPDDIWLVIATALSGTSCQDSDVYWLLPRAADYILEDGQGGRAVYRLVHQWLTDHLRPERPEPARPEERAVRVAEALVDYYLAMLDAGNVPKMVPYLFRYLWRHCADAGEPGIEVFRKLVARHPRPFTAQLALAIDELARSYGRMSHWEECVRLAAEAVDLWRGVAAAEPASGNALAVALTNLARLLVLTGEPDAAAERGHEAVDLLRQADSGNPAVRSELASALTVLALCICQTRKQKEALEFASEAVSLLRPLEGEASAAFNPELAEALSVLSMAHLMIGEPKEALDSGAESVNLYRTLNVESSSQALGLAWALSTAGMAYYLSGCPQQAVDLSSESVAYLKGMEPTPFTGALTASALIAFALGQMQLGQNDEAGAAAEEALQLLRTSAVPTQSAQSLVAYAFTVLAQSHLAAGRMAEALEASRQAADASRDLDAANPVVMALQAYSLNLYATATSQAGQAEEAWEAVTRSIELLRGSDTSSLSVRQTLGMALSLAAGLLIEKGQPEEAYFPALQALFLLQSMDMTVPSFKLCYALAHLPLVTSCLQRQNSAGALSFGSEAVTLLEALNVSETAVRVALISVRSSMSAAYAQTSEPDLARESANKAVELAGELELTAAVAGPIGAARNVLAVLEYQEQHFPQALENARAAIRCIELLPVSYASLMGLAAAWSIASGSSFETGQPDEGANAARQAIAIYNRLSGSNPLVLQMLAESLESFDPRFRAAGLGQELDALWREVIDGRTEIRERAMLLTVRASLKDAGQEALAADLINATRMVEAEDMPTAEDREVTAALHELCRSMRDGRDDWFDETWQKETKEKPPAWLTLSPTALAAVTQWNEIQELDESKQYYLDQIAPLDEETVSTALDELELVADASRASDLYDSVLEVGVDRTYDLMHADDLLAEWLESKDEATWELFRNHRGEFLGDAVEAALTRRLAENPDDGDLIACKHILMLARAGKDDIVEKVLSGEEPSEEIFLALASSGDLESLASVASMVYGSDAPDDERALAGLYSAAVYALSAQPDDARKTLEEACELDAGQHSNWLAALFRFPPQYHAQLLPLIQALVESSKTAGA